MSQVGHRARPKRSVLLPWMAAPLTWDWIVDPFDALSAVSTVKCMHAETLSRALGLRQRDHSRRMKELQESDGFVADITYYGMSCSFPLPGNIPPRFSNVASFTKKQFVNRGVLPLIPSLFPFFHSGCPTGDTVRALVSFLFLSSY